MHSTAGIDAAANWSRRAMQTHRVAEINAHRDALGYPHIADDTSHAELKRHERLIDKHAPYGNDPWARARL